MLKPRKKLTKKQLKEDKFIETTFKVQEYLQEYGKYIGYAAIALFVIIAASVLFIRSKRNAEIKASAEVTRIEGFYINKDYDTAIPELTRIAQTYSGTRDAGKAMFYLANCYFEKKDFENARVYYNNYINDYGDDKVLTSSSYSGVAACYEETGDYTSAAEWYMKAVSKIPDSFLTPENLLDAGRCYLQAGNPQEAKTVLDRLVEKYPDSTLLTDARGLLARI